MKREQFFALTLIAFFIFLPQLSGCKFGGGNPLDAPVDLDREMYISPMPNLRHFVINPIGPGGMFKADGYCPICEDEKPLFTALIFAPSEGPLADVVDVKITTAIDGEIVGNEYDSGTGTLTFSPSKPLLTGRHIAAIQLTLDDNTFPPVIKDWIYDVYNEPPRITKVLYNSNDMKLAVFFDRPVPEEQILDLSRWDINLIKFSAHIETDRGLMSAFIYAKPGYPDYQKSADPVYLNFHSYKGKSTYKLFNGTDEYQGSRSGQEDCTCDPVTIANFDPMPSPNNPHSFDEDEPNAWAYWIDVTENHCDLQETWEYSYATVDQLFDPWNEGAPDCGYFESNSEPYLGDSISSGGQFIITPGQPWHTLTYPHYNHTVFSMELNADNNCDPEDGFETFVGLAGVDAPPDLSEPAITYGPYILTGWQAAREIENIVDEPGDDKYYYGLLNPPTLEGYLELLRTVWEDRLFVMAGGLDHAIGAGLGNLREICPLELDIYDPPITCPPMMLMTEDFILRCDRHPLGLRTPGPDPGGEYIDWPDTFHYPIGFPNDDFAFNEQEWALWDITDHIADICAENDFSMRVRVTDHVDNWVRSGEIEMRTGIEGVDIELNIHEMSFYRAHLDDNKWVPDYLFEYCHDNCEGVVGNQNASAIEMRDLNGECILHLVVTGYVLDEVPTQQEIEEIASELEVTFQCDPMETNVPDNANASVTLPLELDDIALFENLIQPPDEANICAYLAFTCHLKISDQIPEEGDTTTLFVSHRDNAYENEENRRDYTVLYGTGTLIDFKQYALTFQYGSKRGEGIGCSEELGSPPIHKYYSQDQYIQAGGIMRVQGELIYSDFEGKTEELTKYRPVQSAADLLIVATDSIYTKWKYNGSNCIEISDYQNVHSGVLTYFDAHQESGLVGCCTSRGDFARLSPITTTLCIKIEGTPTPKYIDHDFYGDHPYDDYYGQFWHEQPCFEPVTWLIHLACATLSDDSRLGYSPYEVWKTKLISTQNEPEIFAHVICGYSGAGARKGGEYGGYLTIKDVGAEFTKIMKLNEPLYSDYYINENHIPSDQYLHKPVRAWMEAHCHILRNPKQRLSKQERICLQGARATDGDYKWEIEKKILRPYRIIRKPA